MKEGIPQVPESEAEKNLKERKLELRRIKYCKNAIDLSAGSAMNRAKLTLESFFIHCRRA